MSARPKISHAEAELAIAAMPVVYHRDTVLTMAQVAAALQVSERTLERNDFPVHYIGRLPRYIWGEVLDALAKRNP